MSLVADYTDSDENSDFESGNANVDALQDDSIIQVVTGNANNEHDHRIDKMVLKIGHGQSEKLTTSSKATVSSNFLLSEADSSSSDSCGDEEPAKYGSKRKQLEDQTALDNPFRTFGDVNVAKEDSVFRNPFREKEDKRIAVLEHHVKMTQNPVTALTINGKKICWNYRKRKCYLGTQCPFAHDSDVPLTEEQLKEQKLESDLQRSSARISATTSNLFETQTTKPHLPGTASVIAGGYDAAAFYSSPHLGGKSEKRKSDSEEIGDGDPPYKTSKSKKRVGLTNTLIPSKKALNLYNKTKDKL